MEIVHEKTGELFVIFNKMIKINVWMGLHYLKAIITSESFHHVLKKFTHQRQYIIH